MDTNSQNNFAADQQLSAHSCPLVLITGSS
jgi:hypothetical protein